MVDTFHVKWENPPVDPVNRKAKAMTIRVQIPAYTDRWMMGDRYGEIVKVSRKAVPVNGGADRFVLRDVAKVKLDKSGKTIKVILDDCQWVSS